MFFRGQGTIMIGVAKELTGVAQLAVRGGQPRVSRPLPAWPVAGEAERRLLLQVLESGIWGLGGALIPKFEERFASYQHTRFAVLAANGTVTLEMALRALSIGPGDEVIVPAYTFIATAAVIFQVGAIPVVVDIDPRDCNIDPVKVEAAISERTRAIIAVHVGGGPADLDRLTQLSSRYGVALIEDAAQAHGAEWRGRRVGSFGVCGSFSFQSSKNLTCGEGGALVTNDESIADFCRALRNAGRWTGRTPRRRVLGTDYRLTEFQAALLLAGLDRLDEQTNRRNQNALYLASLLQQMPDSPFIPALRDERVTRHAYHLFLIRLPEERWQLPLERVVEALQAEGVPARRGYQALYQDPLWIGSDGEGLTWRLGPGGAPEAERAAREVIWLPQRLFLGDSALMEEIWAALEKVWRYRDELRGW
ncbi:MAG: DegT/DnrJ/EryC1/StrS family aminotransferase [Limnochordales bacterium]|nr:DegT/DnrJ/EryC1/StrS family aminotransferase [Limnochordales bacterium]